MPNTRAPGFAEECRRQSRLAAEADKQDPTLDAFLDAALMKNTARLAVYLKSSCRLCQNRYNFLYEFTAKKINVDWVS
ncbi:antitoxin MazE-like protein [Halomonas sp. GXIMD04776]|uniref:antitoxin MazE-like protein n=1 Tax=Halomonas sp. GXIMD04776 TaxID=3415605 RepID=UPI003CA84E86